LGLGRWKQWVKRVRELYFGYGGIRKLTAQWKSGHPPSTSPTEALQNRPVVSQSKKALVCFLLITEDIPILIVGPVDWEALMAERGLSTCYIFSALD